MSGPVGCSLQEQPCTSVERCDWGALLDGGHAAVLCNVGRVLHAVELISSCLSATPRIQA